MSESVLNITVNIADRPYRMKVTPSEEANVRKAAKLINDKIAEYQNSYHATDKRDYLAMVALLYTSEVIKRQDEETKGSQKMVDTLADVGEIVDSIIENIL